MARKLTRGQLHILKLMDTREYQFPHGPAKRVCARLEALGHIEGKLLYEEDDKGNFTQARGYRLTELGRLQVAY